MSQRITYQDKTNPTPVVDRTKQATAEDFNDIKQVVNANGETMDALPKFSDIPIVVNNLITNLESVALSASQGVVIKQTLDEILTILQSDDLSLDELQEVVTYIKQNREDLQNLSWENLAGLNEELEDIRELAEMFSNQSRYLFYDIVYFDHRVQNDLSNLTGILGGYVSTVLFLLLRTPEGQHYWVTRNQGSNLDYSLTSVRLYLNRNNLSESIQFQCRYHSSYDNGDIIVYQIDTNLPSFSIGVNFYFTFYRLFPGRIQFPEFKLQWGREKRSFARLHRGSSSSEYSGDVHLLRITIADFDSIKIYTPTIILNRYRSKRITNNLGVDRFVNNAGFKHEPTSSIRNTEIALTDSEMFLDFKLENFFERLTNGEVYAMGMKKKKSAGKPFAQSYMDKSKQRGYFYMNVQLRLTVNGTDVLSDPSGVIKVYQDQTNTISYEWM